MELKIDEFLESDFWKKSSIYYDVKDRCTKSMQNKKFIVFGANLITLNDIVNFDMSHLQNSTAQSYHPELYASLRNTTLPLNWKKEILSQWQQVIKITQKIQHTPKFRVCIICSPGSEALTHIHPFGTKQTITVCFNLSDNLQNEKNYFTEHSDDDIPVKKTLISTSNKTIFTWKDNYKHSVSIKCMSFFWVHDYNNYVDLTNVDLEDFDLIHL